MGVLALSFGSHKNFNRPLSETPALSHPKLFSGWNIKLNKKWDCVSLPTETSCCALNATPTHPTLLLVSFVFYKNNNINYCSMMQQKECQGYVINTRQVYQYLHAASVGYTSGQIIKFSIMHPLVHNFFSPNFYY